MPVEKFVFPLMLLASSIESSASLGGALLGRLPGGASSTEGNENGREKLFQFTFNKRVSSQKGQIASPNFQKKVDAFLSDLLIAARVDEDEDIEFESEAPQATEAPTTVVEQFEKEDVFPTNSTGDFLTNSTEDFPTNSTGDFLPGVLTNRSGIFEGNWTFDFSNRTADFNETGDFIVNNTMGRRRLGTFYQNERNYIRVADEAVDLRLDWKTDEKLVGGHEKYFINPGVIFVENEDGSTQWVRTIRYHSTGGYSNGVTSYIGEPVNEGVWVYFTSILLGSEEFPGDLSGGFDDESISQWGIQSGGYLSVADDHMLSNEDSYEMWEDLCEAKPGYLAEKHTLTRKKTTGAEDPKLFVLPSSMNERSKWAVTFSSYPPVHSIEGMSSPDDCKWSEYSKFQMYIAPGGEQLANGIASPAHRLSCGSMIDHEKNWIAFDYEDELYYVQNVQPHVVVKVNGDDGNCEKVYETSSSYLEALSHRVSVRGSATAYRYSDDEYIALLHTHDDYSREPYTTRAYTFETHPPFRVLRVSKPLPLQSAGLAFASSLTLYQDKIMVGYGVADRESRMMVMSRDYLEQVFTSDCDGSVDRIVGLSGESCAEKVVSLMLGEDLMPPRRAMNTVGMSFMECRGLLDHHQCEPEMVLKVSRHNRASNCNEAFARMAAGVSCSSRMKWAIANTDKSAAEAFRVVSDEFKVCRDVISLECTEEDLHYPESTCKASYFNNYENTEPAVLLSTTNADQGNLEPMIQCSGISTARGACENKDVSLCLEDGKFHLVKAKPVAEDSTTAHHTIDKIRTAAAAVARRQLSSAPPKVFLHTRNPLEIVFEDVLLALSEKGIVAQESAIDIIAFKEASRSPESHELIMRTMLNSALQNIRDWEVMKDFVDNPSYDVLMITDEELSDRLLQPAIVAEISRRLGLTPDHNTILDGLQASETLYTKRQKAGALKSSDFYLESSAKRLQYICHMMEMAPMFLQTTVEQGYGHEIGTLTEYCVGFDEEWLMTAGEEIFTGFSETM